MARSVLIFTMHIILYAIYTLKPGSHYRYNCLLILFLQALHRKATIQCIQHTHRVKRFIFISFKMGKMIDLRNFEGSVAVLPDLVFPESHKQPPSWDFYKLQFQEFTENVTINKNILLLCMVGEWIPLFLCLCFLKVLKSSVITLKPPV